MYVSVKDLGFSNVFYVPPAQVARQLDHRSLGGRMDLLVIPIYVKVP